MLTLVPASQKEPARAAACEDHGQRLVKAVWPVPARQASETYLSKRQVRLPVAAYRAAPAHMFATSTIWVVSVAPASMSVSNTVQTLAAHGRAKRSPERSPKMQANELLTRVAARVERSLRPTTPRKARRSTAQCRCHGGIGRTPTFSIET